MSKELTKVEVVHIAIDLLNKERDRLIAKKAKYNKKFNEECNRIALKHSELAASIGYEERLYIVKENK